MLQKRRRIYKFSVLLLCGLLILLKWHSKSDARYPTVLEKSLLGDTMINSLVNSLSNVTTVKNNETVLLDGEKFITSRNIIHLTNLGYINFVQKFCSPILPGNKYEKEGMYLNGTYCNCSGVWRGRQPINMTNLPENTGGEIYGVQEGGWWKPFGCRARQNVAIIVPFRDRESHLFYFLHTIHPLLQKQQLAYRLFVIEQAAPKIFNKAAMMDIGFLVAQDFDDFDCFIFHDVDMLPEDDRNLYICSEDMPRHLGSHVSKFHYVAAYSTLIGGATAFTPSQFRKVNGYSTEFYGWGGEDDDMYNRIRSAKMEILRYPAAVARSFMIVHAKDKGNPYNEESVKAWKYQPAKYKEEGLNSLKYTIRKKEEKSLYTWIYAEIPEGKLIQKSRTGKHKVSGAR